MKRVSTTMIALTSCLACGLASHAYPQDGDAPAAAAAAAAPAKSVAPQDFKPGLDDLMTLLVTPRHLKLYYAATERNWELAAFEAKELRSSFRRIQNVVPVYQERNVEETIKAMMAPRMEATEKAIAAGDLQQFKAAYQELTQACNACHTYLEHPFIVVKAPEATAQADYPNQDFKPAP